MRPRSVSARMAATRRADREARQREREANPPPGDFVIFPLRRVADGHWKSRDERWTFLRHWSDPHPQRWFGYLDDDEGPLNDGAGHVRLADVAEWAERMTVKRLTSMREFSW